MKLENAAALAREDVTTLTVVHCTRLDGSPYNGEEAKEYTYKVLRSLAQTLAKDDIAVVKNARGVTVARVVEVHDEPHIELDDNIGYRWAFQRVNIEVAHKREREDEALVARMREQQRRSVREQVLQSVGMDREEVQLALRYGRDGT